MCISDLWMGIPKKCPLKIPPISVLKLHFPWLLPVNNQEWQGGWAGQFLGDMGLLMGNLGSRTPVSTSKLSYKLYGGLRHSHPILIPPLSFTQDQTSIMMSIMIWSPFSLRRISLKIFLCISTILTSASWRTYTQSSSKIFCFPNEDFMVSN